MSKIVGQGAYDTVTVGTTAGAIVTSRAHRKGVVIFNNGTVNIYLGTDDSVTTSNGLPIPAGASGTLDSFVGDVYGISGTDDQDVRYLEIF